MSSKDPADPQKKSVDLGPWIGGAGALGALAAFILAPGAAKTATGQAWPPFVLVAGLLVIGVVADHDGLFKAAGARLAKLPGGAVPLYLGLMSLVALVTIVLNLDTSVAFLTPVLIHTARRRKLDEGPFLYGAVFMSNSASLLLPGSNLTNLLVLAERPMPGLAFAGRMAAPAVAAIVATLLVVALFHTRALTKAPEVAEAPLPPMRLRLGALGTLGAAVALVTMDHPALVVLGIAVVVVVPHLTTRGISPHQVVEALGPPTLVGLFGVSVGLGAVARSLSAPAAFLEHASAWMVAGVAALATVVMNNLPAAVLLSSWAPGDRRALLIGLNLGPNLAITGALSALLWLRIARQAGARPSALRYSLIGLVLVPASIAAAVCAAQATGAAPL